MDKKEKKKLIYMLPARDSFLTYGHLQIESEGMEKHVSCKWTSKESQNSNTCIEQNRV